jgi:hypothetical protein
MVNVIDWCSQPPVAVIVTDWAVYQRV